MTSERVLPHNLEAERSVLGAILVQNDGIDDLELKPTDFLRDAHRRTFRRMLALREQGVAIDFVTLKDALVSVGDLEEAGGAAYLGALSDGVPKSTNIEYYARIVRERARLREVIDAANVVADKAYGGQLEAQTIAADAQRAFGAMGHVPTTGSLSEAVAWPEPLSEEAFHGPLGALVRLVEPHTEADPAALLIQSLVMFGNIIGPHAHFTVSGARHTLALYAVLVGMTSKGRKGTSYHSIATPLRNVDETLADPERVVSGLSSGEGLIWSVRDAVLKGSEVADPGILDKRKLVVEGEFASVLKQFQREGNILSAVIRQAWDTGSLGILTKSNTAKATGAHISIIGHVTKDELRRYLTATEAGNGFGNRFLWVCTKRSKELPEGGELDRVDFGPVLRQLQAAVAVARACGELRRDDAARRLWAGAYHDLSEGQPGLFGAMTSRAEAQVLRLAGIYAIADRAKVVTPTHLRAALAVWRYCEESARFIFGSSIGDPMADELDAALQRAGGEGLTRTAIRDLFARNGKAGNIDRALTLLTEHGRAARSEDRSKPGRPVERWTHASYDRNHRRFDRQAPSDPLVVGRNGADAPIAVSTNDINDITPIERHPQALRPTTEVEEAPADGIF